MKTLVAGWFSFEYMGATAGDLLTRDLVCDWLDAEGVEYDVALAPAFGAGVAWQRTDPSAYSHVVFACGPFGKGPPVTEFLERFDSSTLVGVNLSMLDPIDQWNPFDLLLERDSSRSARPDLSFLASAEKVPVVGLVLVHPQEEYGDRGRHDEANRALRTLTRHRPMTVIPIDTQLDENDTGMRCPSEVESAIAKMDLVLTTRLHGTVLALKNHVPPLAVDPIAGGAKITRQARTIGWPLSFSVSDLADNDLESAFAFCLTEEARQKAAACKTRATAMLGDVEGRFREAF